MASKGSRLGAIASVIIATGTAHAQSEGFRIRHAEPVVVTTAKSGVDVASSKSADAQTVSFVAYGRQFELDLEANSRLLNALSASQRGTFESHQVYRGRVRGLPGSWVRIVRSGATLRGAIWDGTDLYSIGPAQSVARFLEQPLNVAADAAVVYRISDTVDADAVCAVGSRGDAASNQSGALGEYSNLVSELQAMVTQLPDRQIEIAFVGDTEFVNVHSADPQAAALARINIVDGIFAEQVGVMIVAPVVQLLSSDTFTGNDPTALLNQLSDYRAANPAGGLTHLFTGRGLNNNVIGIAQVGVVCEVQSGVGLAEAWRPELESALISAHEIGHNFDAPHDGEDGSACVNVPRSFIMSPFLNHSTQFSQCSLNQMYFEIENASCIVPASTPDARMQTEGLVIASIAQPFAVPFEVASIGTADIPDAEVSVAIPSDFTVVSATVAGGTCTFQTGTVACGLGPLAVGALRTGAVQLQTASNGTRTLELRVRATGDRRSANDADTVRVDVGSGADLSVGISPSRIDTFTEQSFSFVVTVASVGTSPVVDARVLIPIGNLTVEDLQAPGATCTGTSNLLCTLGNLNAGEIRQVTVQARSAIPIDLEPQVSVVSTNDANAANNVRSMRLAIAASADAMIEANIASIDRTIGETFELAFTVASIGPQAVQDVLAQVTLPAGFELDFATGGGVPCVVDGTDVQCTLGTLASRTSRSIVLRGRGTIESRSFTARVSASNDGDPSNDQANVAIDILPAVDVAILQPTSTAPFENRPFELRASFTSRGIFTARDVIVSASLPASFQILEASAGAAACQIAAGSATCTLSSLPPGTSETLRLQVVASQTGSFTVDFAIAATGDDTAANNSVSLPLVVNADVDVSVTGPAARVNALVGMPFDIPLTVRTGLRPVANVNLTLNLTSGLEIISVTPALTCQTTGTSLACPLGELAGQTTLEVVARVRFDQVVNMVAGANVQGNGDTNPGNDFTSFTLEVDLPADAELTAIPSSFTVTTGQAFMAEVQVRAVGSTEPRNVSVRVVLPAAIGLIGVEQGGCSVDGDAVVCSVDNPIGGSGRGLRYHLVATTAGEHTISAQLSSTNDVQPANDSGEITVVATAASLPPAPPPPPPPPPPNTGGGGGGGGALGWSLLALLLGALRSRGVRLRA